MRSVGLGSSGGGSAVAAPAPTPQPAAIAAPAPAPAPAPVAAPAPLAPIQADVNAQRKQIGEENARLNSELEASRRKTATGIARNARARRGNIFEEGLPNQGPFGRTLGS